MSIPIAKKRVHDFEDKYGHTAFTFACYAALPAVLNADLVHLLRINFFLDPPNSLPYASEFEFLLSPLCQEIDDGLYEIKSEIRGILLEKLYAIVDKQQLTDITNFISQYIDRTAI